MPDSWRAIRAERVRQVNCLVILISSVGRRFFNWGRTVDYMEMDARGRLWWNQRWNDHRLYLHSPRPLGHGFSHGGTLRSLVLALKKYAVTGEQLWWRAFGPWETFGADGLWGYGEDMLVIRDTARALGILKAEPVGECKECK
jgi:hypothetical protein